MLKPMVNVDSRSTLPALHFADGFVAVVKHDCPTCVLVAPVLAQLAAHGLHTTVSQDDPAFPEGLDVTFDNDLEISVALDIDTVPTLLKITDGKVVGSTVGWSRDNWESLTGISGLGTALPDFRPGCGSMTNDPVFVEQRAVARRIPLLKSRTLSLGSEEDEMEALFERGFTDGLPVVPPTPTRVARMLGGTTREPQEIVAIVPPDLVECTVEKVAVNAVMAGCKPEYLPIVLAAVEAACTDEFNAHGLLCTTYFAGPMLIVNGPITRSIGMNSGVNALGQGNRANATIGRALQLVIRNVGGGRPGEIDRATLGNPGKYTFCFAEREHDSPWEPLHVSRAGMRGNQNAVTLFAAAGVQPIVDQLSREPESLARSFAAGMRTIGHPKQVIAWDCVVVVTPEHARVFHDAGWSKQRLHDELMALLQIPGDELIRGAGGMAEGLPEGFAGSVLPKFRDGGLLIVHAGGEAGMFSALISGWASGAVGSEIVTQEVRT
jgi:hypothetical protein